eukprot:63863-Rhodomonas_salina.3
MSTAATMTLRCTATSPLSIWYRHKASVQRNPSRSDNGTERRELVGYAPTCVLHACADSSPSTAFSVRVHTHAGLGQYRRQIPTLISGDGIAKRRLVAQHVT